MAGESKTTTDHDEIRKWIEDRGGRPASVEGTGDDNDAGLLRIDFNEKDDKLEEVDWGSFFDKFEEKNLAFLYQDTTADGQQSRFFKFISR